MAILSIKLQVVCRVSRQEKLQILDLRLMKCTLMAAFETESCQSIFFIKALLFFVLVCIDSREHERKDELC